MLDHPLAQLLMVSCSSHGVAHDFAVRCCWLSWRQDLDAERLRCEILETVELMLRYDDWCAREIALAERLDVASTRDVFLTSFADGDEA